MYMDSYYTHAHSIGTPATFDSRGHRHERLLVWEKNLINVTKYTSREIEGNRVGEICAVEVSIGIL